MDDTEQAELEAYYREAEAEVKAECLRNDRVFNLIHYVRFVSKSKGRNRKPRRNWVEVHLVSYSHIKPYRFYDFDKAPLDEWATEILEGESGDYPEHKLRERIIELWGY